MCKDYKKNNVNSVSKLQDSNRISCYKQLCYQIFVKMCCLPSYIGAVAPLFLVDNSKQLTLMYQLILTLQETIPSYTAIVHFCGSHSCLLYSKNPIISKSEF
jgi:hypothetical protein